MPAENRIIHDAIEILDSSEAVPDAARELLAAALSYRSRQSEALEAAIGLALQAPEGLSPQQRQTLLVAQIAARHDRPMRTNWPTSTARGAGPAADPETTSHGEEEQA